MQKLPTRALMLPLSALIAASLVTPVLATRQSAPAQTEERSRTQGLKETDRFVKAGGNTSEAVANAKLSESADKRVAAASKRAQADQMEGLADAEKQKRNGDGEDDS